MSSFVSATSGVRRIEADDRRLMAPRYGQIGALFADVNIIPGTFATEWWPARATASFVGDGGADVGILAGAWWGNYDIAAGASSRFGFVGVTRDQWGTAIPTCTVYLFRTSDNVLVDTTTSDPSGNFLLNTSFYPDTHYIVAHKSGSPDVDGVTPNTLIGT